MGDVRGRTVSTRVTDEFGAWLDDNAAAEQRTNAQMVWVLLLEARANRDTPAGQRRAPVTPYGLNSRPGGAR